MYPQSLSLPSPHFPQAFAEGATLPRRAVCAGGKSYHIDPSTGQPMCLCQLPVTSPLAMSGPATHNSPSHSPVSVHLPPFTAARAGLPEHFAAAGLGKDQPRSIPLGGPYPPTALAAYHPYLYAGYEMSGIRKAAVRETTGPLKAWLHEHKKNPYPTKAEKVMLAIITQMTLTQVSTWFANARRRLKKENRSSWESGADNDNDKDDVEDKDEDNTDHYENLSDVSVDSEDTACNISSVSSKSPAASLDTSTVVYPTQPLTKTELLPLPPPSHHQHHPSPLFVTPLRPLFSSPAFLPTGAEVKSEGSQPSSNGGSGDGHPSPPATKPRIWSISAIIGLDKEESYDNVKDKSGKASGCGGSGSNSTVTSSLQHVERDGTDSGICSEAASHRSPGSPGSVCSHRSSSSPQSSPNH